MTRRKNTALPMKFKCDDKTFEFDVVPDSGASAPIISQNIVDRLTNSFKEKGVWNSEPRPKVTKSFGNCGPNMQG